VKYRLSKSFCGAMYHGCELWHLDDCKISDFCIAWRKALRRIWNVPYNTHCELVYCLCNDLPVFDKICKRSLRFIAACLSHYGLPFTIWQAWPAIILYGRP